MAFRMKGNYKVHVITMAVALAFGLAVSSIGIVNFFDSSYMQNLTNPTLNLAAFASHAFLGIASFASGIALVALLLMDKAVAARSNLAAKVVAILWIVAYVVGVSVFVILRVI